MDPTLENLIALVADLAVVDPADVTAATSFTDLGLDSLDHQQLIIECGEQFEIDLPESATDCLTVQSLYQTILTALAA